MSTSKLDIYNVALRFLGERSLDSLTEDGEPRRELDAVWSSANGIRFFLQQGRWKFAMRTQQIDADASVDTQFGYQNAFQLPDDFVHLDMLSADEYFSEPLFRYEIEAGYIFADEDPLYIRFISDDDDYGGNYANWPETMALWAGCWIATQIAPRLTSGAKLEDLMRMERKLLVDARSKEAVQSPTRFPPAGSWVNARHSYRYGRRDRGRRNTLIG